MLGKFELAAADRGMRGLHHGVCPPIRLLDVLYRAAGVGGKRDGRLRIAECGLRIERPRHGRLQKADCRIQDDE